MYDYYVVEAKSKTAFQRELDKYGGDGYRAIHVGYNPDREKYFAVMEKAH